MSKLSLIVGALGLMAASLTFAQSAPVIPAFSPTQHPVFPAPQHLPVDAHVFNHAGAHAACKASEGNHDAHKACLHQFHLKNAHPHHHRHISQAFNACHAEKDLKKHDACLDNHLKTTHAPHAYNHAFAHEVCARFVSNHDTHKACLYGVHMSHAHPMHRGHIAATFTACHVEKDIKKHAECLENFVAKK